VRLRIEGRVQGVGFRAFVEREAVALGLDGWVRNRRDGGVEVLASGSTGRIESLIDACRRGPRGATVALLKVLDEPAIATPGFVIAPTV
jgi:acylphosphatase